MKTWLIGLGLAQALVTGNVLAGAAEVDEYALERYINGGVSATGAFATQAEKDTYMTNRKTLDLEPCINGGVSATGMFASQAKEDLWLKGLASN